jgi:hypothetical protein
VRSLALALVLLGGTATAGADCELRKTFIHTSASERKTGYTDWRWLNSWGMPCGTYYNLPWVMTEYPPWRDPPAPHPPPPKPPELPVLMSAITFEKLSEVDRQRAAEEVKADLDAQLARDLASQASPEERAAAEGEARLLVRQLL